MELCGSEVKDLQFVIRYDSTSWHIIIVKNIINCDIEPLIRSELVFGIRDIIISSDAFGCYSTVQSALPLRHSRRYTGDDQQWLHSRL